MPLLSSREAYQCLRDAALGVAPLQIIARSAEVAVCIDGWRLSLALDDEGLAHCSQCASPDGRQGALEDWHRYGTNPVDHLSRWERQRIEQLLG